MENEQLNLAFGYAQHTNKNIFLTGKAGTGKTTFLHQLKKTTHKRMAIVAPTGVAAINAGGVTIHSFFQLPFGPYIPQTPHNNRPSTIQRQFNKDKINLIRSLDLLVIDEISMVRADTLDSIDEVLRRYKNPNQPFGGVQLLMIGDLHQLSPVIKDDEWQLLQAYYPNIYFFSSLALNKTSPVSIELKHIYRQSDSRFIDLLNAIRNNQITKDVLDKLNERYIPDFAPNDNEGYITLTTHNQTAQNINDKKLIAVKQPSKFYKADIKGDFDERTYPTSENLELKLGAQVMFVKNDPSPNKLFYNGKIGKITRLANEVIHVKCLDEEKEIVVTTLDWNNIKFTLNNSTKQVEEQIIGSFTQFPLKLAWAITIHKSQGLTFEKAIIDANLAFAFGQVYVALSRCKSFDGMVLRSPIVSNSVKTSHTVADYTKNADQNQPCENQLKVSKIVYQQDLLMDMIDFTKIKSRLYSVGKLVEENYSIFLPGLPKEITQIKFDIEIHVYAVAASFKKQLENLFSLDILPEENAAIQERIKKACIYFANKLEDIVAKPIEKLNLSSDNKTIKTTLLEAIDNLQKEAFVKLCVLNKCVEGFNSLVYLQTVANAELDYTERKGNKTSSTANVNIKDIPHGELYKSITLWRNKVANDKNIAIYLVLSQKTILSLIETLPATLKELEHTKGIGKGTLQRYGNTILQMVNEYCESNRIERKEFVPPVTVLKIDTKTVSYNLYKTGKSIEEIAAERNFTIGTIEGHLTHFITEGKILVTELMQVEKLKLIMEHIKKYPDFSSNQRKMALGENVSYADLRAVANHLLFLEGR
jgi:hypothetical protein